jgi:hypothetical protein
MGTSGKVPMLGLELVRLKEHPLVPVDRPGRHACSHFLKLLDLHSKEANRKPNSRYSFASKGPCIMAPANNW